MPLRRWRWLPFDITAEADAWLFTSASRMPGEVIHFAGAHSGFPWVPERMKARFVWANRAFEKRQTKRGALGGDTLSAGSSVGYDKFCTTPGAGCTFVRHATHSAWDPTPDQEGVRQR